MPKKMQAAACKYIRLQIEIRESDEVREQRGGREKERETYRRPHVPCAALALACHASLPFDSRAAPSLSLTRLSLPAALVNVLGLAEGIVGSYAYVKGDSLSRPRL